MTVTHLHIIPRAIAAERGMNRYFTGTPCPYGHVAERRTVRTSCLGCQEVSMLSRRAKRLGERAERAKTDPKWVAPAVAQYDRELASIGVLLHLIPISAARKAGLVRYFTGKPCPKGHITERFSGHGSCVGCLKELNSTEEKRVYWRERYHANSAEVNGRKRQIAALNDGKRSAAALRWAKENPEKRRSISKAYKARRRCQEDGGDPTPVIHAWEMAAKKVCYWCHKPCEEKYHVDHYEPLARGGKHVIANLVIACPSCNVKKNAKDPYAFAASLGRLF